MEDSFLAPSLFVYKGHTKITESRIIFNGGKLVMYRKILACK